MARSGLAMAAVCAALIRCGGDDGGTNNAAAAKTFDYGTPATATSAQRNTIQAPIASAASSGASGAALGLASFGTTATALLGSPGVAYLRTSTSSPDISERRQQLNAGCITENGNTITYKNCQESFGSGDFRGTGTLDGTISISSDSKTASWNLSTGLDLTSGQLTEKIHIHQSGSVTADGNRIRGDLLEEVSASVATGAAAPQASAFDEEVIFDLTFQKNPFCITSGTFEAKRVWREPAQAQRDKGAKLVWTGCNQATMAQSI